MAKIFNQLYIRYFQFVLYFLLLFIITLVINGKIFAEVTELVVMRNLIESNIIKTGLGVKSVVISLDGLKVYSINLEEMSIYEFDRKSRNLLRKVVFIPHAGTGFDYKTKTSINSYQEKPVEGHITHDGQYLWVSLHNGDGVVVWGLKGEETWYEGQPYKDALLYERSSPGTDATTANKDFEQSKINLLWIKTGKTPKVITSSPDGKYLFVANWHSCTVSVIDIKSDNPQEWRKIKDLKTGRIPRGLVVSPDSKYLYVAQMGDNGISVVDIDSLSKIYEIKIGNNPRHIVTDGRFLYVSLNAGAKLAKVDIAERKVLKYANTGKQPRTIVLSKDGKTLFVVCYLNNKLQAFSADNLEFIDEWKSSLHPVAVDLYQEDNQLEIWTGNYSSGTLKIFSFD